MIVRKDGMYMSVDRTQLPAFLSCGWEEYNPLPVVDIKESPAVKEEKEVEATKPVRRRAKR